MSFGQFCLALFLAPIFVRIIRDFLAGGSRRPHVVDIVTYYIPSSDSVRGKGPMTIARRVVRQRAALFR